MRTHFIRPARVSLWIAGVSICVLSASAVVAIVRSIPASYASTKAAPARITSEPDPTSRRSQAWCPDCGVVESIRMLGHSANTKIAADVVGGNPGRATAQKDYEITVRFRDGSTTVFNQASPESWRLGSRVIVVGRSNASNN
jgi:hypothetical protein